jgi:hypothetical protein
MTKPTENLPVEQSQPVKGMMVAIAGMDTLLCNVPMNTPEQQMVIFNAIAGGAGKLDDLINKELMVKNAIIARHDWTDKDTGEINPGYKVWLILQDDLVYFSGSNGLTKSLQLIQSFRGLPPWKPPVKCVLKQIQITDGQRWLHLNLVK